MATKLKVAIAFNIVLTILLGVVVLSVGYATPPFARDFPESIEIKMVPVQFERPEWIAYQTEKANAYGKRIEIPPEYQTPDQSPSPWVILPDGSIRFRDLDR